MAFISLELFIFLVVIYVFVQLTSQQSNYSPRSKTTDALISPVYILLPSFSPQRRQGARGRRDPNHPDAVQRRNGDSNQNVGTVMFRLNQISYNDFSELYHSMQLDLLLSSLLIGIATRIFWGFVNWILYFINGSVWRVSSQDFVDMGEVYLQNRLENVDSLSEKKIASIQYEVLHHIIGQKFGHILPRFNWWIFLVLLFFTFLLYFQWRIVWKRLRTLRGNISIIYCFAAWIVSLLVLFSTEHLFTWDLNRLYVTLFEDYTPGYYASFFLNESMMKFVLSLLCSLLSFTVVMPVARMIHCHWFMTDPLYVECMQRFAFVIRLFSFVSLFSPVLVSFLWLEPVRNLLSFIDDVHYKRLQLYGVIFVSIAQIMQIHPYLQSFLLKNSLDCVKEIESNTLFTESEVVDLKDKMLNGFRLTFVVYCQLLYIPSLLIASALLLNTRGDSTFGFGNGYPTLIIEPIKDAGNAIFTNENFHSILAPMIGKSYDFRTLSHQFDKSVIIFTELLSFILSWVIINVSILSVLNYILRHIKKWVIEQPMAHS